MLSPKVKILPTGVKVISRVKNGKEVFKIESPYPNDVKLKDIVNLC